MKTVSRILTISLCLFSLGLSAQMDQDALKPFKDQQILDDLIVDGSICAGFDCVNGESFGFTTIRLKENNVRLEFTDTSVSASFPSNDWMLEANSSSNGGSNHFAIVDISGGRTPFLVEAGAPTSSLYVDDGGRIGLGTATPVVEMHMVNGDSPTLRLEQDGSSGFTAQTWDVVGNETNFFIRDATNGSRLPFRITPSAPTNSIFVASNGDVGLGDASPDAALDIESGDLKVTNGNIEINGQSTIELAINGVTGNPDMTFLENGNTRAQLKYDISSNGLGVFVSDSRVGASGLTISNLVFFVDAVNDRVGIGTSTPSTLLEVNGTASKPGGGSWAVASDKRLKKNIKVYDEGLDKILSFKPVSFQYNGKGGISDTESTFVGLIAQEAQEVASHMVSNVARGTTVKNCDEESTAYKDYLMLDPSAIPYMLINAIKEQQAQMDAKDEKIESLESKVDKLELALNSLIDRIGGDDLGNNNSDILNEDNVVLSMASLPYIKQNVPNPYDNETSIDYFVPETAQNVTINFFDNQGKLIKSHVISQRGEGKLNVRNEDLPAGTYVYSLIIDGQMLSSKKMSVK